MLSGGYIAFMWIKPQHAAQLLHMHPDTLARKVESGDIVLSVRKSEAGYRTYLRSEVEHLASGHETFAHPLLAELAPFLAEQIEALGLSAPLLALNDAFAERWALLGSIKARKGKYMKGPYAESVAEVQDAISDYLLAVRIPGWEFDKRVHQLWRQRLEAAAVAAGWQIIGEPVSQDEDLGKMPNLNDPPFRSFDVHPGRCSPQWLQDSYHERQAKAAEERKQLAETPPAPEPEPVDLIAPYTGERSDVVIDARDGGEVVRAWSGPTTGYNIGTASDGECIEHGIDAVLSEYPFVDQTMNQTRPRLCIVESRLDDRLRWVVRQGEGGEMLVTRVLNVPGWQDEDWQIQQMRARERAAAGLPLGMNGRLAASR